MDTLSRYLGNTDFEGESWVGGFFFEHGVLERYHNHHKNSVWR
jgi:hypothetical protein